MTTIKPTYRLRPLSLSKAQELAKRITDSVDEGFRYVTGNDSGLGTCHYVPVPRHHRDWTAVKGSTGCLVGRVLAEYGVSHRELADLCGTLSLLGAARELRKAGVIDLPGDVVSYLSTLQDSQDSGTTWHRARQEADTYAKDWLT